MRPEYAVSTVVLLLATGAAALLFSGGSTSVPTRMPITFGAEESYDEMPYVDIVSPSGFVNTPSITIGELIGKKVVLVDFLTYSCINCQRTFPYLNAWYDAYKDEGLEIVGIHTPEFAFEKNIDNVRAAMKRFGITHPIVLDNDYATWRAYGNNYWPRKYLIDIHGTIVYDHIGEGAYEETEMKIRELLAERARVLGERAADMDEELATAQLPEKEHTARSPETYFGSLRNTNFANGPTGVSGKRAFTVSDVLRANSLYLDGIWNITNEYAESEGEASVLYRFLASDVFIVADADMPASIEVWLDGTLVQEGGGSDVTGGTVHIRDSRLYEIIELAEPGEHVLELKVKNGAVRFYAFTFG